MSWRGAVVGVSRDAIVVLVWKSAEDCQQQQRAGTGTGRSNLGGGTSARRRNVKSIYALSILAPDMGYRGMYGVPVHYKYLPTYLGT